MITQKSGALVLLLCLQTSFALSAPKNLNDTNKTRDTVALTTEQAERIVEGLELLMSQARKYDQQNKAPRPDAAQPCDSVFPACNTFDLSELSACCCAIRNILCCVSASILDVIGNCADLSTLLPSVADKSDIDALCLSTVSLLKTILLELRGAFLIV